jgi:preprotein translocase subunit YajC
MIGGVYVWILLLLIVIGVGTIVGLLKEQSNQNKRIIELLEDINKNK